jgi:hypothetical protein
MKKLILAAVLATLAGSTAFAQPYNPGFGTANIAPVYTPANPGGAFAYAASDRSSANSAYAQEIDSIVTRSPRRMTRFDGAIEGDPDPNIAFQLHREAQEG